METTKKTNPIASLSVAAVVSQRIRIIESARGFAAFYVFVSHLILVGKMGQLFHGANYVFQIFNYGHQAVLLFFFLSGFSIHYSSRERKLNNWSGRLKYFYLRLRRLYPLYLIAILVTLVLLLIGQQIGLTEYVARLDWIRVFATTFFLADYPWPGHWFEVIPTNTPLWSLAYEVIYYALYPIFWLVYKKHGIALAFGGTVALSVGFSLVNFAWQPNHLSNVVSLYWLWGAGALLAEWRFGSKKMACRPIWFYAVWFAVFSAAMLSERQAVPFFGDWMWGLLIAITMFSFVVDFKHAPWPSRMMGWVSMVVLLAGAIGAARAIPYTGSRTFLCLRLVLIGGLVCWLIAREKRTKLPQLCSKVLRPFYPVGEYSYGLYVIHMPLLIFAHDLLMHWGVGMVWLWLWLALPLIVMIARILELKWQPKIAASMDSLLLACSERWVYH